MECPKCGVEKSPKNTSWKNKEKALLSYNCKKCQAKYTKIWREKNSKRIKKNKAEYFKNNKDNICKQQWERKKEKRESDPDWYKAEKRRDADRIKNDIRQNLRHRIVHRFNVCGFSWVDNKHFLGIEIDEFIDILIDKIKEKTTIDEFINGGWHIDHIKPLFSFANIEEGLNYKNVQILRDVDHYKKNGEDFRKYARIN